MSASLTVQVDGHGEIDVQVSWGDSVSKVMSAVEELAGLQRGSYTMVDLYGQEVKPCAEVQDIDNMTLKTVPDKQAWSLEMLQLRGVPSSADSLVVACNNADLELAQLLLDAGVDGTSEVYRRVSILNGAMDSVLELLLRYVPAGLADEDGDSPILLAAENGCLDICKHLIEVRNVSPCVSNHIGTTPLIGAVTNAHRGVAEYLSGIPSLNVNAADIDGDTALHVAVSYAPSEFSSMLLRCGADPWAVNASQLSPVHIARSSGRADLIQVFA